VFVVADDENHLGGFDLSDPNPGRLLPLFDEGLPPGHAARKAAKPDCEALVQLPAFGSSMEARHRRFALELPAPERQGLFVAAITLQAAQHRQSSGNASQPSRACAVASAKRPCASR
jgi:hypothetical protein